MNATYIGFTGSRTGITDEQRKEIHNILSKYDNIVVSHGDCVGADTEFHNICREYDNIIIRIYPPKDPKLRAYNVGNVIMDEQPYLIRNKDIVDNSDILIACPKNKNKPEKRSGTWSTIRYAQRNKLIIYLL